VAAAEAAVAHAAHAGLDAAAAAAAPSLMLTDPQRMSPAIRFAVRVSLDQIDADRP
jgi:hypothetical protein